MKRKEQKIRERENDYFARFLMMCQWVAAKQKGVGIDVWLRKHNISKIAIYGMGQEGDLLLKEVLETEIEVIFAIDKKADRVVCADIDVVGIDDVNKMPRVDAVIVSSVAFYYDVREKLEAITGTKVVSLHDILYDM